jgi:tyrosinase
MSNPTAVRLAIAAHVKRLYGSRIYGDFSSTFESLANKVASGAHAEPSGGAHAAPEGHAQPDVATSPDSASTWDWCARVHFKHMELDRSFSVSIFLGPPPEDPKEWQTADTFVGAHYSFVNSAADACANCESHKEDVNEGFVHLNGALAAYSKLGSFEPDVVKPYLAKELHWRAQRVRCVRFGVAFELTLRFSRRMELPSN